MRMASIGRAVNGIMVVLSHDDILAPSETFVFNNLEDGFRKVIEHILSNEDKTFIQIGDDVIGEKKGMN